MYYDQSGQFHETSIYLVYDTDVYWVFVPSFSIDLGIRKDSANGFRRGTKFLAPSISIVAIDVAITLIDDDDNDDESRTKSLKKRTRKLGYELRGGESHGPSPKSLYLRIYVST